MSNETVQRFPGSRRDAVVNLSARLTALQHTHGIMGAIVLLTNLQKQFLIEMLKNMRTRIPHLHAYLCSTIYLYLSLFLLSPNLKGKQHSLWHAGQTGNNFPINTLM